MMETQARPVPVRTRFEPVILFYTRTGITPLSPFASKESPMAKSSNQKLKLLYLARIFYEETDEENALDLKAIRSRLSSLDIPADRKTLYQDFEALRSFGMDIIAEVRGRNTVYYLGSRTFELPELKLLVDSVQSARFITERKSAQLIKKLETLTSQGQARQLQRQVLISGRIKTMNESIYYTVDQLHTAIRAGRQIEFQYFSWNTKKEPEPRHGGKPYRVSPWALLWNDEYYYLVAFDSEDRIIKHFRVDKLLHIEMTDRPREGKDAFEEAQLARYSARLFRMFGGEVQTVTLECRNDMANILIDRFGHDIRMVPRDDAHFTARVDVAVSLQFLSWVMALGDGVTITGPEPVVRQMKDEIARLQRQYEKDGPGLE